METCDLLPGSFTLRRAGLDLTLSRRLKVQVVGKAGGASSPLLIPQDNPAGAACTLAAAGCCPFKQGRYVFM